MNCIEQGVVATWPRSIAALRQCARQLKCETTTRGWQSITGRWPRPKNLALRLPAYPHLDRWRLGLLAGRAVGLLGHDRTKFRDAPDLSGAIRERPGLREAGQPRTAPRTNPTPATAVRSWTKS